MIAVRHETIGSFLSWLVSYNYLYYSLGTEHHIRFCGDLPIPYIYLYIHESMFAYMDLNHTGVPFYAYEVFLYKIYF